jgi:hypothetical protein
MSGAAVLLARDRAGRLEPTRLGLRSAEATAADESGALAETALRDGEACIDGVALSVRLEAKGEIAHARVAVHNTSERPRRVDAVVLGFAWRGHGLEALRFLRHGWQSWSFTGTRDLDGHGEPRFPSGPWLRGFHHAVGAPPEDRLGWHESAQGLSA